MSIYELIDGDVKVEWSDIGEGLDGFYNPDDPDDVALLRFDVSRWDHFDWEPVDDASYCTRVPVDTPKERLGELLRSIMDEVGDDVRAGISIKKKCEALSWITA